IIQQFNEAPSGQTVFHLHIHLIPRFIGDCHDPRGGVRKIFPDRASYWKSEKTSMKYEKRLKEHNIGKHLTNGE
ncbi:MAG TPA: hypothetical protein PLD93_04590, partial [Synergistaceae bacterium]|nr:hypothetical protein [Synergistaceae bacterium]